MKTHTPRIRSLPFFTTAALCVVLVGCSNPADDVPEAAVKPAEPVQEAQPPSETSATKTFVLLPDSKIGFVGSKVTGSHDGGFTKFAGELTVVNGKLAGSGHRVVIDMNSTWSDNERLTGHLKSADFFDVEKFPTAEFVVTSIEPGNAESRVTGNLTLHGVTKNISFPAIIRTEGDEISVTAAFFINRFDFGIIYPGKANDLIRKEVVLKLDVKAAPDKADFGSLGKAT